MSFSPNELTAQVYEQSRGADLYRRGIYTFLKRTVPPPSMEAFGAGGREVCTVQRSRPNTPFQPLVLLNDPTYVEAARALAQRMMTEGGLHPRERINYGFRLAVSRAPRKAEQGLLVEILNEQLRDFRDDCNAARRLLAVGEFVHNPNLNEVELAAWTIVAQMLLNMSETITRG